MTAGGPGRRRGGVLKQIGLVRRTLFWVVHGARYKPSDLTLAPDLALNEEYGPYIRGSFLGRFDEATWGPSSIFTDVDGYLHTFFRSGQAGNRSHVADAQVDAMIEAQRRVTSPSSRKRIIDEIQRHGAAQAWYVFTPCPRNVSSWGPRVRNYGPKSSFDRGAQLEVLWLEPS